MEQQAAPGNNQLRTSITKNTIHIKGYVSIEKKLLLLRLRAAFTMRAVGNSLTAVDRLLHVFEAR